MRVCIKFMKKQKLTISMLVSAFILFIIILVWNIKKNETLKDQVQQQNQSIGQISKNDLVWYEVPELGIRFKVTPDTKNDLKYFIKEDEKFESISAYFYSQSTKDFIEENSKIAEITISYSDFALLRISEEKNKKFKEENGRLACLQENIITQMGEQVYCKDSSQSSIFSSKEQYEQYQESIKNKKFGLFFDEVGIID